MNYYFLSYSVLLLIGGFLFSPTVHAQDGDFQAESTLLFIDDGSAIDFREWALEGILDEANWEIADDGSVARQTVNSEAPTFLVSPDVYEDVGIRGTFGVETGRDDDYIGFAVGYRAPIAAEGHEEVDADFILFDWKQRRQGRGPEGFRLTYVKGRGDERVRTGSHGNNPLWNMRNRGDPDSGEPYIQFIPLADPPPEEFNKGWEDNTLYEFGLHYTPDVLIITIQGGTEPYVEERVIFSVDREDLPPGLFPNDEFPSGRFAFYSLSQEQTAFHAFSRGQFEYAGEGRLSFGLEPRPGQDFYFILDASGSMMAPMRDEQKFDWARRAVQNAVEQLSEGDSVALRAQGHRRRALEEGAEEDSELLVPMGRMDAGQRSRMVGSLAALRPLGLTPITQSLIETRGDLRGRSEPTLVILLTDGRQDTATRRDPMPAAEELGALENVEVIVLGFDIHREDWRMRMETMAQRAGGTYLSIDDGDSLVDTLGLLATDELPDQSMRVYDSDGHLVKEWEGLDKKITLPSGRYVIELGPEDRPYARSRVFVSNNSDRRVIFPFPHALDWI